MAPEPEPVAPLEPIAELPENAVSKSVYKKAIDGILTKTKKPEKKKMPALV